MLSPFVVNTAADNDGYRATSTLAGSRIKTDLKDVAASVSVLTNEFLDDLGAKDVASAMAFVSGAENDSAYHQESIAALGSANGYVGGDFATYRRKAFGRTWTLQLNINNVFDLRSNQGNSSTWPRFTEPRQYNTSVSMDW